MAALPVNSVAALAWQTYGTDGTDLVAPVLCDFTTYSLYSFNPTGIYRQRGTVVATGVVVDNLLNSLPITVMIGPITETIPPYTKNTFTLNGALQVSIAGTQAKVLVSFFYGTYGGTTQDTNFYAAQIAAGLAVETGFINIFAGSTASIPVGYLLCDGTAVSRTTYAGLFSKIGTLYGAGDGSTTFNLPNLSNNVPIGAGTIAGLGQAVGEAKHALTAAENGPHAHTITDPGHGHSINDPGHTHSINDPGHAHRPNTAGGNTVGGGASGSPHFGGTGGFYTDLFSLMTSTVATGISIVSKVTGIAINAGTTGITVNSSGSGTPHNIVQPSLGLNFVIKT